MSEYIDLPAGIAWTVEDGRVTGKVIVVHPNGRQEHVATVRYGCAEDAARAAMQLLDALGGDQ